jgi:predicted nucleic acid-binding protein
VALLLDTTVGVLLLRRRPPAEVAPLLAAAHAEIATGGAAIASATVAELVAGERDPRAVETLSAALNRIPAVPLSAEVAGHAGAMGAFLFASGAPIPVPDLMIAATALWLEVPLLTWDGDFQRSRRLAVESRSGHPGAVLWRTLELHPASRPS